MTIYCGYQQCTYGVWCENATKERRTELYAWSNQLNINELIDHRIIFGASINRMQNNTFKVIIKKELKLTLLKSNEGHLNFVAYFCIDSDPHRQCSIPYRVYYKNKPMIIIDGDGLSTDGEIKCLWNSIEFEVNLCWTVVNLSTLFLSFWCCHIRWSFFEWKFAIWQIHYLRSNRIFDHISFWVDD